MNNISIVGIYIDKYDNLILSDGLIIKKSMEIIEIEKKVNNIIKKKSKDKVLKIDYYYDKLVKYWNVHVNNIVKYIISNYNVVIFSKKGLNSPYNLHIKYLIDKLSNSKSKIYLVNYNKKDICSSCGYKIDVLNNNFTCSNCGFECNFNLNSAYNILSLGLNFYLYDVNVPRETSE